MPWPEIEPPHLAYGDNALTNQVPSQDAKSFLLQEKYDCILEKPYHIEVYSILSVAKLHELKYQLYVQIT